MRKLLIAALLLAPVSALAVQVTALGVFDAGSNQVTYTYVCWVSPPNPLPNPTAVSQWKALSGLSTGPTTAQQNALTAGTVSEYAYSLTVSSSTTITSVQDAMWKQCSGKQNYLNGIPGPGIYYGFTTVDGATWSRQ